MPGILDRINEQQRLDDNAAVAQAAHNANWANTFNSTPSTEVLRSRVNYVEAIDRALKNKMALEARSSLKAQELVHRQAEHEERMRQAALRGEVMGAQVAATGATERRRAEQARTEAEQTAALNQGMSALYQSGLHPSTPEFRAQALDLLAGHPFAHTDHLDELARAAGFEDRKQVDQAVADKVAEKRAAADLEKRLSHLETLRNRKGLDDAQRKYLDGEIAKVHEVRKGKGQSVVPAGIPGAPATDVTIPPPAAPAAPVAPSAAAPAGVPKAGDEDGGYRFKGGDPADRANWEKL